MVLTWTLLLHSFKGSNVICKWVINNVEKKGNESEMRKRRVSQLLAL